MNIGTQEAAAGIFSFRLPKNGAVDPYFGGSRSFWNARILPSAANNFQPAIQSFVDKKPGTKRGTRFIAFASARTYFQRLAAQSNPAPDKEGGQ